MTRSDPHRRPLRHTYQEGPGFLFLATRGGRPPGPRAREDLSALRFRIRCVRTAEDEGVAAALALGVTRTSLHRWRRRYAEGGIEALRWRRRGPNRQRLPVWVERIVIVVRLLTYWNSKRLAAEFTRRGIYPLDHNGIDHVLAAYGAARPGVHRERGPAYERSRPDELWHIDIKGPFFLQRAPGDYMKVWIVGLVDDHSRYLIGLRVLPRPATEPVLTWLHDCFELVGVPLEIMSDNGAPFVVWMPGVLTLFGKTLEQLHIKHVRTRVNSPWTNGKIERFWGVLQSELLDRELLPTPEAADEALTRFAVYYDYHRLNGAIGWQTPAERWDGTPLHRSGLRACPRARAPARLADRADGGVTACSTNSRNYN